jgi:hypothetical protein
MSNLANQFQQRAGRTWSYPSWWNLLVALPWALGVGLAVHGWMTDRKVAERERTALGTVTVHEPANHNRYGYTFAINGHSYSGWESPRRGEPQVGELVTVYYDPNDPTTSALTDFAQLKNESLGPVPLLLFGIGALAFFIRQRRRSRQTMPNQGQGS